MPKKASINSFTGGLSLDFNEQINTEKVLTDAVNATLVTGNGDEYSLQNDMGNVKIPTGEYKEYAQLEDGYIPIGVKELNGVAYLVSYNPETKKTQLGTYPGPRDYTLTLTGTFNQTFPSEETIYNIPLNQVDDDYLPKLRYGDKISIRIPISVYNAVNIRGIKQEDKKAWDLEFITKINNAPTALNTEYSVYPTEDFVEIFFTYTQSTGELAVKVTPNKILSLTVGCSLIKKEDFNKVKEMSEDNNWMKNIIEPPKNLLVFDISYTHNTNEYYINGFTISVNNGGKEDKTYFLPRGESPIEACYVLDDTLAKEIKYRVTPITFNKPQENCVDGEIYTVYKGLYLNTWKYNDSELTYGFIDNTLYSSKNRTLTLTFVNVITKKKSVYTISDKKSFNGTFSFDNYSELDRNSIYLCEIKLGDSVFYRWVYTDGRYNEAFKSSLKDFGSSEILQYNTIEATFDPFAGEEPQMLVKDEVTSPSPFISKEKHSYGAQTLKQTHHVKVQNSRVFYLDDNLFSISDSPTLPTSIQFTAAKETSEVPINSVNNTFVGLGDAATWVRENSSKLDDQSISTQDGVIDFVYTNRSAAIGKIKELNTVTSDSYFRPFMIDPKDVSRDTRIALRSNMLAFGNEIRKDYLPMEYLMLQVLRNGDENTLQRYLINRESVDSKVDTVDISGGKYLVPIQLSDEDDARNTDLGSTAKLITETSEELVQEGISVVDDYASSLNKEVSELKEDTDYVQVNVNSSIYDKLTYSSDSNVDLTSKDKFDDFKLIPFYFLNAHNWSTNKFLPTLFFIGSYNLIDGLYPEGSLDIKVTNDDGTETTETVETYDSWDGYMYDNTGNKLSFDGGNNPRADSGWQCREGYNSKYKYSRYNTLIPLWMNDDGTYTTLNYLIHYLNALPECKNVTNYSKDNKTLEAYKNTNLMSSVIKNLIELFKNYYLYTNLRIEIPNLVLYVIDPENTTYTTQYTNNITYTDVRVPLSDSDLWIGDFHYTELIERTLTEFPNLTEDQKESLRTLSKMNLVGYNPSITFTQRQKSYSEYIDNYISGDIVHYPICYTGTQCYLTANNQELNKDKCYILGENGLSEATDNKLTLVNVDAPIGNYSTLLLDAKNQVQVPSSSKPPFAPSLYKHNGMFLTTKNLPINLTVWNLGNRLQLMYDGKERYNLPDDEQNYFYNTNKDWNILNGDTK